MKEIPNNEDLKFVFEFSKTLEKDNLNYIYRGLFSQSIIVDILSLTEKNIVKAHDPSKVKKKVYNLMVECLQNITKHQVEVENPELEKNGLFTIQYKGDRYYITTGNLIAKQHIKGLKNKIEEVNSLDKAELKKQYREQLMVGKISKQGGAGLGFIDMARKSGNKLYFDFKKIDDEYSFFYFRIQISTDPKEAAVKNCSTGASLKHVSDIHKTIIDKNIVLVYNNVFDEESQTNLLSYLQSHLAESVLSRREVYNVMVEMMSNIVKHGATDPNTGEGKEAIFYICEKINEYQLFSGNYIENNEVVSFKQKLETINYLDRQALDSLYKERTKKNKKPGDEKQEIGMIDMRLKSIKRWDYHFHKSDKKYSYFTLQICVSKE